MLDDRNKSELVPLANVSPRSQNNYYELQDDDGNLYGKQARVHKLREWRRIIFRHKWLILSLVLVALPYTAIRAYRAKPLYQATTTIDVRPEASSLSKIGDVLLVDSNDNTKAEIFIIRSQPVLEKTVESLKLDSNPRFMDVTTRRSILETLTAIKGGQPEQEKKLAQEAAQKESGIEAAKTSNSRDDENLVNHKEILPNTQTESARLEPYLNVLSSNINIEGVRDTRLIKISFTHTDPDIAATVANGIASSFISYNFQTKTQRFTNTSDWLEDSTRKLKAQVEQAEQRLANYSRENNIFSLEGKENLTADKMVRLHDQVMRAETDRLLKQSLYEEVKQGRVAQLPEAFADPKTADLRKDLNELAVTASETSVMFGAKHPKLQEIRQKMATIQEQINAGQSMLEERLKADFGRAVRDEQSLKAALNTAKSEAVQQNQAAIQYSVLQQDLATAKALYTDFLNKTSQANIQRAEQFNNVRLIERAKPPGGPIGPNRTQTIMLGLIISLALGIGLAYLIENLNTAIRTVDDVTRATQLPTLAVIPTLTMANTRGKRNGIPGKVSGRNDLRAAGITEFAAGITEFDDAIEKLKDHSDKPVLADSLKHFSVAAEAYRMLRTSILLSTAERPPKTILITSGQPSDGKTTTVFNTAIALTQLQAEVLIVDCDMRKPRIHKLVQLAKAEGLSTFLTSGGDLEKLINRSPVPYLSILPCGYLPPNPSELISSEKMKELLRKLSEQYDYIIIDSPPLMTVTDPLILSTLVDGVILVVRSGQSKSELVSRARQELAGVGAKVLGAILNHLNLREQGYDYYYAHRNYSDQIYYGNGHDTRS